MAMLLRSFVVTLLISLTACAHRPPPTPLPAPQFLEHTVKFPGETYGLIAKWYTGSSKNWEAIRDANPTVKPNKLKLGTVLAIPRDILTTDAPLPKKAVPAPLAAQTPVAQEPGVQAPAESLAEKRDASSQESPIVPTPSPEDRVRDELLEEILKPETKTAR